MAQNKNAKDRSTLGYSFEGLTLLNQLLLLFFLSLCCSLLPNTNMSLVCPLKAELVICLEWFHFFSNLDKLNTWLLTCNWQVWALDLGGRCKFLRCRVTSLQESRAYVKSANTSTHPFVQAMHFSHLNKP